MRRLFYIPLITILFLSSCHQEENISVEIDVILHTKENLTSPLLVTIENRTRNADEYLWTFEGGEPATSNQKNPEKIMFITPGEHTITLEAWNINDRTTKTYTVRVDSMMTVDFNSEAKINNYAPAQFNITNLSSGGTSFKWIFEGGTPAVYEGKQPPTITYHNEGKYPITLIVNNGSELSSITKEIEVREALEASFEIVPSFDDLDDLEAPLRATFDTRLKGVVSLYWECEGASITNPDSKDAGILFQSPGHYTVILNVSNGKTNAKISQNITVKKNTNLRTHRNVKLGISTAQESIGSFYSTKLRQVIKSSQVNEINGALIDIAYMGFNSEFTYNIFISPNKAGETVLNDIPNARATKFINKTELGNIIITPDQFNSMIDDELIKELSILPANYGDEYFTSALLPRIVLFETSDGRKGAILVKNVISEGKLGSYILTDIKVQKNDQ